MENASKALIIAGGVLIAIMILSIGVYLIGELGKTADSYVSQLDLIELQKYNSNFEIFADRIDITSQDIITVLNVAQQKDQGTKVFINGKDVTTWSAKDKNIFLSENILIYKSDGTVDNFYSCTEIVYDAEHKVNEIRFKKI